MQASIDNDVIAIAHRLADKAGEIIRPLFKSSLAVTDKADESPVTEADRAVEKALREMIEAAFPDHGIIGEEFGNVRESAPWQWVLDPIDGTRAFIGGQATFTTLIALAKDGVPVLGVIDQAITKERWFGITGQPSLLNGQPIRVRDTAKLTDAFMATTSIPYFTPKEMGAFEHLQKNCASVQPSGDGYAYAQLASGNIDLVVDAHLKPYDFCALKTVIEGAGGIITDWTGKPLTIKSDGRALGRRNEIAARCNT